MADSVMPVQCGASRRGAGARLRSAVTTVVRSVTVAAGVFAPGHLGELTRQVPFELVDAALEQTRATEQRLRTLPSRVGVYFVLALALFPGLGAAKVWTSLLAGLAPGLRPSVSDKALRDLRRRIGAARRLHGTRKPRVGTMSFQDPFDAKSTLERAGCSCGAHASQAEHDTVAHIKRHVKIPVVANGDIDSPASTREVLQHTGADAIMIGRAAQGRPWIFREIAHFLSTGEHLPPPALSEVRGWLLEHLGDHYDLYGEDTGVRSARKHLGWYAQSLPLSRGEVALFRARVNATTPPLDVT